MGAGVLRAQALCAGLKVGGWGLAGEGGSEDELQRWEKGRCSQCHPSQQQELTLHTDTDSSSPCGPCSQAEATWHAWVTYPEAPASPAAQAFIPSICVWR